MNKFILNSINKITVKTTYDNGMETTNDVVHNCIISATNKALAVDAEKHGKKIASCKIAIHTVLVQGEERSPQIESILQY